MRINKILGIFLVFSLSACSMLNGKSTALNNGDYAAVLPYEDSNTRVKHVSLISNLDCRVQIEQGLMDLSKKYFSPDEVAYKTHAFLDYDELDATDGSRGLLGTLRDNNPIGLNPSSDEEFDTGNGFATGPIILVDIYELDWYAGDALKGVSISLVVNGSLYLDDGSLVNIDEVQLESYFDVTSNKLVSYMRERFNEVTTHVPIYVSVYQLSDDEDTYGGYIRDAYFNGTQGKFGEINENWYLIPSNAFAQADSSMANEFVQFKDSITNVLTDYTYVTGRVKMENNKAAKVEIKIETHAKSAGEILAVGQMAKESMSIFSKNDCRYTVRIVNNGETYVIIQRKENSSECSVISTI